MLLTNIFSAYEQTCVATKVSESPMFPKIQHTSLHAFLNEYITRQVALVKYFKRIPEFDRLSITDKIRLIRNHFCITMAINEATLSTNISAKLITTVKSLYEPDASSQLIKCITLIHAYTNDRMLLKLLLIVRALSSGINRNLDNTDTDRIYDDSLAIFSAQNIYVELLWRYLMSRFPSEFYVVKFYNKLVRDLLFTQRVCFLIESRITMLPNEIQQMHPLIQSMWPTSSNDPNADADAVSAAKLTGQDTDSVTSHSASVEQLSSESVQ